MIPPVEMDFETFTSINEVKSLITEVIAERKGTIKVSHDNGLVAKFGSGAKTRFLGGMWINAQNFPRDVLVSLSRASDGTKVRITVRDTLGIGSRAGMADKYQKVMFEDAIAIRSKFKDAV